MARLYISISPIKYILGIKRGGKMIETLPGGEPIILEKVPVIPYCGGCMIKMKCMHGTSFMCPICGMNYNQEFGA